MPSRAEEMSKLMHVVATALYGRNGGGPPDDDKKGGPSLFLAFSLCLIFPKTRARGAKLFLGELRAAFARAGLPPVTSTNLVDPRPSSGPATTFSSSPAIISSSPATTDNVVMDNGSQVVTLQEESSLVIRSKGQ
ncbi:hypothetical protein TGAM01_v204309 [Trichoderma gamsii]|uniref:Uncharacterized protein n=1 Tax=Trichoderma gamsii TaxID=398673 RepID=A0A2P4ZR83_9HYPO|nr:hypothetical protein TGAM01_v204309 [Trichoderma gamsii]PON26808.1 hypothetical protein TGAM01_v204309 [Trichoderma gamsii]